MEERIEIHDKYTHLQFDEEDDLEKGYWFWDAFHTPPGGPWTPMYDYLWWYNVGLGATLAYDRISSPTCMSLTCRSYRGYNVCTAVPMPEAEREERAKKYREALRPFIENIDEMYEEIKSKLMANYQKFKNYDSDKASWADLIRLVREIDAFQAWFWEEHVYYIIDLFTVVVTWEELSKELLGITDESPIFQKLLRGFDNKSFQVDRELFQVARRADQLGLRDIILATNAKEVISKVEEIDAGREWLREFREFLNINGWRSNVQMEGIEPSWIEDPAPAVEQIQAFLRKGTDVFELDEIIRWQAEERKEAEEDVLSKLPTDQREWYEVLMRAAQKANWWGEDHAFYFEFYNYTVLRYCLLQIGKRLCQAGAIEQPDDTIFLIPAEIIRLLCAPYMTSAKACVRRRRAQWE